MSGHPSSDAPAAATPNGAWPSPLPLKGLLGGVAPGGRIKERAGDFLVDELPLYDPSGSGEHLYLGIQKQDVPHGELIATLARHFKVRTMAIGFAGMKDRCAVTRQTVSIHLPGGDEGIPALDHPGVMVLWASRHGNKLRRGHLAGNRFSIRIRGLEPHKAPLVWNRLKELACVGVPDFYGPQRFGYRANNHVIGAHLLRGRWKDALDELLGSHGAPFPDRQADRRALHDQGDFAGAQALWGKHDHAERAVLRALAAGATHEDAVRAGGTAVRDFWIAGIQSAVFNRTLMRRLDAGSLGALLPGDRAYHHRSGRSFRIDASMLESGSDVLPRLAAFEISPSGLMPGRDFGPGEGVPGEFERAACADWGLTPEDFATGPWAPTGARRPLRVPVLNAQCDGGFDEHGPFVRVAFDLPAGGFATVVLQEVLGTAATE